MLAELDDELPVDTSGVVQNEDGGAEVNLTAEEAPDEVPFAPDFDAPNMCEDLENHPKGVVLKKKIVRLAIDDFETDKDAGQEYREKFAANWKLFSGFLPPKDFPFQFCANAHIPTAMENVMRLVLQVYGELFPNFNNVFTVRPVSGQPADQKLADILTMHGNWQIREQLRDFPRQMHRGLLGFWFIGDVSGHSFYDHATKLNAHEILTPDEFITPFTYTTTKPDYSDLPHYTKIMKRYEHELAAMKDEWFGVDDVIDGETPSWEDEPESLVATAVSESQGVQKPDTNDKRSSPHTVLWYEGWFDLPNQNKRRWCQAIIHYKSRKLLKFCIHERANWQEKIRYRKQLAELEQYRQAKAMHDQMMAQIQGQVMGPIQAVAAVTGELSPLQQEVAMQDLQALSAAPLPPPPQPPQWAGDADNPEFLPEEPRKEPIYMFSHAVCIEPLVGNLGFSYGGMQCDLNRAVNVMTSQDIDNTTLGSANSYITTTDVEFERKFKLGPMVFNRVKGIAAGDLQDAIMPLKPAAPNPHAFELIQMFIAHAQSSMNSNPVLSGEPGKSGEPFKGLAMRLEQATKPASVMGQKYRDFVEQLLRNNAYLNSVFLPEEEMVMVTNSLLQGEEIPVGRYMYEQNYLVQMNADMRFTSTAQKIQEADEIVGMVMTNPYLMQNMPMAIYAIKKAFEARGRFDLVQMLPAPPPPMLGPDGQPMQQMGPPLGPDGQPLVPPQAGQPPGGQGPQPTDAAANGPPQKQQESPQANPQAGAVN